ncbi:hypothetical protein [Halorientalis salina]|uniref:hypothetical protein n=1 Tax=Halorientalis salina TaxID=2932266 RepID=UPI0010AD0F9A|nr:hypothetical protein [Halorientalis salina]
MSENDTDVAKAAAQFHEEIPHRFQVSLTMSMETRDALRAVRDAINEECPERVFTTDDVVRFALQGTARYHALASNGRPDSVEADEDVFLPLSAVVREALEANVNDGNSATKPSG